MLTERHAGVGLSSMHKHNAGLIWKEVPIKRFAKAPD
jgi:hypothetical protein